MRGKRDQATEVDFLERGLLQGSVSSEYAGVDDDGVDDDGVLYSASFVEMEDNFVKFKTAQWILYSFPLILAWGIGIFMLLYLPVRIHVLRKELRSRKLYMTPNAVVYKVATPVVLPCFGLSKKENHVLLPLVANIVVEQGYLESIFGIYSIRIENGGVKRPVNHYVQIQGVADPRAFRKAVLTHLSSIRGEGFSRQASMDEDPVAPDPTSSAWMPISRDLVLQKLEEVESSVKKVQTLMEKRSRASEIQGEGSADSNL